MAKRYLSPTDDGFRQIVVREMYDKATPDEMAYLHSSEQIVTRWNQTLVALKNECLEQTTKEKSDLEAAQLTFLTDGINDLAARQKWYEYQAAHAARRSSRASFMRHLDARLADHKTWRREVNKAVRAQLESDPEAWLERLKKLCVERGKALAIFALKDQDIDGLPDEEQVEIVVTVADVRRVRAALMASPGHTSYTVHSHALEDAEAFGDSHDDQGEEA